MKSIRNSTTTIIMRTLLPIDSRAVGLPVSCYHCLYIFSIVSIYMIYVLFNWAILLGTNVTFCRRNIVKCYFLERNSFWKKSNMGGIR